MLNTLLHLQRQKAPAKTIGCPTDDLMPGFGSGLVTIISVWQMDYAARY